MKSFDNSARYDAVIIGAGAGGMAAAVHLVAAGKKVGVYKPVASGCELRDGKLVSADAVALWEASGRQAVLHEVCPQRFLAPLAPAAAAAAEGRTVDDALLLSVSYTYKVNNRDKQRRYIHHLVWHQFDGLHGTTWEDPEWVALNPAGFEYGVLTRGGIHDRTSDTGLLSDQYPGFVNRYGTGNVPDDKADLFAYMMVLHPWVMDRAREDRYLRAKVDVMKARLAQFDPSFNDAFWARIDRIGRDVTPYVTP